MIEVQTRARIERQLDISLWTGKDWADFGALLQGAIVEDLSDGVKPSTGRRMPKYRDPERSGVDKKARVKLYKSGRLYQSFRATARRDGVRVESGHGGVFWAWILDRRFRFMTVPKSFRQEGATALAEALEENLNGKPKKAFRQKRRRVKRKRKAAS